MTPKQKARAQQLIVLFVAQQRELFDMGLHLTAAEMGKVTERIGWELAEKIEQHGLYTPEQKRRRKRDEKFLTDHPWLAPKPARRRAA